MHPIRKRIYLGNLPFDASEEEVTKKFRKFGNVVNVEMKYQSDVSFDVGLPCYAFLDMDINDDDLNSCFLKITSKQWRGNSIKIEIAKESFLSRLEKERQNDKFHTENSKSQEIMFASPTQISPINSALTSKRRKYIKFKDDEEEDKNMNLSKDSNKAATNMPSDEGISSPTKRKKIKVSKSIGTSEPNSTGLPEEANVLDKFESFSDVWKDEATHESKITRAGKKKKKGIVDSSEKIVSEESLNIERNRVAEERRLKSLQNRKDSVKQQKDAVQLALSSVDSNCTKNKRLTFKDDDDEEDEPASRDPPNLRQRASGKNRSLFAEQNSSDEDEEGISFDVKKQFQGTKGQKLLQLKSRYGNDNRFALDERFYDSGDENEKDVEANNGEMPTSDEVTRQLEILKGIVGERLPHGPKKTSHQLKKPADKFMQRFDPTMEDHRRFEVSMEEKLKESTKNKKNTNLKKKLEPAAPKVSQEKYYRVADNLKESLKPSNGAGFSLLEMCGTARDEEPDEQEPESAVANKRGQDWKLKDSQLASMDWRTEGPSNGTQTSAAVNSIPSSSARVATWGETFFFREDDPRLYQALEFFKKETQRCINPVIVRSELKQIARKKVQTAIKVSIRGRGNHRSGNRRYGADNRKASW